MRAARLRLGFKFWLNVNDPEEYELAQQIQILKEKRSFVGAIRDGIRLICDLRAGRTEVLHELFPWVLDQASQTPTIPENPIKNQLDRLEQLLLQQGATPIEITKSTPKLLPPQADVELEIKRAASDKDNNASWNFMIASAAQIYGSFDQLPPQVIEYGLRTGRIPSDAAKPKSGTKPLKGPRKMEVPQLAPPDIYLDDDLDSLLEHNL